MHFPTFNAASERVHAKKQFPFLKEKSEKVTLLSLEPKSDQFLSFAFRCLSHGGPLVNQSGTRATQVSERGLFRLSKGLFFLLLQFSFSSDRFKMWSSRNKILMDTDGDDVAFLSGSGDINFRFF